MKNISFKTHILPHLVAVFIFFIVTFIFFNPVFFESKKLYQHDILEAQGGAKELVDYREKTGEEGLWTNSMFGGMPGYLVNTIFSGELLAYVHQAYGLFLPHPTNILFIAFISFYIALLTFGVRPYLAIGGALMFGLSSYNLVGLAAGHNARIMAVAYMPLVLAGVNLLFRKRYLWGFVVTALGLGLELRAGHPQITYYLFIILFFYGVVQAYLILKEKRIRDFGTIAGLALLAGVLAVGCNFGRLWTVYEYSKYSTRGKAVLTNATNEKEQESGLERDYAFRFSSGITETFTLFVPNVFGGSTQQSLSRNSNVAEALSRHGYNRQQVEQQIKAVPTYWGDQPGTAPYYAGAISVFLFVLALFIVEKKYTVWLVAATLFSIALSWGSNFSSFNYFLFDYLPGYNKFRSVTFTIIIAILCIDILGFIGLERLCRQEFDKAMQKKFLLALGITGGVAFLMILFSAVGSFRGPIDEQFKDAQWFVDALRKDRASLLRVDAVRSLFYVLATAAIFYFYLKSKLSELVAFTLFNFLCLLDIFLAGNRFLNNSLFQKRPQEQFFSQTEADKFILKDPALDYRVLNLLSDPFGDARTSYYHKSLGGYHGAKMRRYQDLFSVCIEKEINDLIQGLRKGEFAPEKYGVLNMLNTKYFIAGNTANQVIPNSGANGNAWFVDSVKTVHNADEEIQETCSADTKTHAIVDASEFTLETTQVNGRGSISLEEYKPNYLRYSTDAEGKSLAVFSEIYYPVGWSANIDGTSVPIIRADFILRALSIPEGKHTVEFSFHPQSFFIGNKVMWVCNILLLTLFGVVIVITVRNTAFSKHTGLG